MERNAFAIKQPGVLLLLILLYGLLVPVSSEAQTRGGLSVATYNLTPPGPLADNIEQARQYANSTVTVIKTLLYSQSGEAGASAAGRRMWFDRNTLQLTITDTPDNLRTVSDYVRSVTATPGGTKKKSQIIAMKHQNAAEVADLIGRLKGTKTSGTSQAGTAVTKTLRVEGELTFRDLRIRITKVNENDLNDDNDDSVEMVIRTATSTEDRTIEEFRSEFIDDYELNVIEVRPSGTPGEGSARIEVSLRRNAPGVAAPGGRAQ